MHNTRKNKSSSILIATLSSDDLQGILLIAIRYLALLIQVTLDQIWKIFTVANNILSQSITEV